MTTFRHFQCSQNLKNQLNWKQFVKLGTDLLSGLHPGQLSFILRASSDTLPTDVNLVITGIFSVMQNVLYAIHHDPQQLMF